MTATCVGTCVGTCVVLTSGSQKWGQERAQSAVFSLDFNGTDRTRTGDPGLMNPLLYQLSYSADDGGPSFLRQGRQLAAFRRKPGR